MLELQASTWAGGHAIGALLDALERAGAATFVSKARELIRRLQIMVHRVTSAANRNEAHRLK